MNHIFTFDKIYLFIIPNTSIRITRYFGRAYTRPSFGTNTTCLCKWIGIQDIKRRWAAGLLIAVRIAIIVDVAARTRAIARIDEAMRTGVSDQARHTANEAGRTISTITTSKSGG